MPPKYQYSADHLSVAQVLKTHEKALMALKSETDSFELVAPEDFQSESQAKARQQIKELNPDMSEAEVKAFVEKMFGTSGDSQFRCQYDGQYRAEKISVTLLSHALCEALINGILETGLHERNMYSLFAHIERARFDEKWFEIPKCIIPNYELDRGANPGQLLSRLNRERNALVHYKIGIRESGGTTQPPTGQKRETYGDVMKLLLQYSRLPYDLQKHVVGQVDDASLRSRVALLLPP